MISLTNLMKLSPSINNKGENIKVYRFINEQILEFIYI